ncbi:MAG: FtsX-like permease family protein, partial [Acidobacteriota bacterium]
GLAGVLGQDGPKTTRRVRLRSVLVTCQVALALVVLISGGLFVRALQQAASIDPGMDLSNVRIAFLDPTLISMPQEGSRRFFEQLIERVQSLPEVESAGLASRVPLSLGARFFSNTALLQIPAWTPPSGQDGFRIESSRVSHGYFEALRISIVEGRGFEPGDRQGAPLAALVNQSFVDRFWPGQRGTGRQLQMEGRGLTVIGVVRDAKYRTLEEPPLPYLYLAWFQHTSGGATLLARPRPGVSQESLAGSLRQSIRQLAPDLPIRDAASLSEHVEVSLLPQRIASAVAVTLGLVALLLALVGLYGVVSYSVSQRTREIGVRMSLGARPRQVVRLVQRQGLLLVSAGILMGIPLAVGLSRLLERFLMGLSPVDFTTYLTVSALLAAVALMAGYLPARRAAQIDPVCALRAD